MYSLLLYQLYALAFGSLLFVFVKLVRSEKLRFSDGAPKLTTEQSPSVSVCIAARNETHAMTTCLENVLASSYEKLEVLVLDDNSSDNTSHLIRAFAQGGVRFVGGKNLPDGWLGRNFALQTLLEEASGEYVLFLDVDTNLGPNTITKLVRRSVQRNGESIAVIPQRADLSRFSTWFATMRYFWEIVLHRKNSPSGSSAAWLVGRQQLRDVIGGFKPFADSIQPERQVASILSKTNAYSLLLSTPALGVTYEKKWLSQIETSRRTILPRFGNSIINVAICAGLLLVVILPQIIVATGLIAGWSLDLWGALPLGAMALICFIIYSRLMWTRLWLLSWIVSPYVAWQELVLLIASAIGYSRGTITWKGRPISRPSK